MNNLAASSSLIKAMVNDKGDSSKYTRNLGKVVIYLKTFEYESISEAAAYEVQCMCADWNTDDMIRTRKVRPIITYY